MPLALRDLFPSDSIVNRCPLGYHAKIRLNFQEVPQNKWLGLADGLLNRQHADIVIADAEMVALSLNVGICDLIVEKLTARWVAVDPPVVIIQQASQEAEAFFLRQHVDLNKIRELPDEAVNSLFQLEQVALDLFAQENFEPVIRELCFQFLQAAPRVVR